MLPLLPFLHNLMPAELYSSHENLRAGKREGESLRFGLFFVRDLLAKKRGLVTLGLFRYQGSIDG